MLKTVIKTIAACSMLEPGDHLLVAVSGGADSVALLRVLALLSPEYRLRLTTAHLNHGLRGAEADEEEAFVRALCAGMGIVCVCGKVDLKSLREKGQSLEEAGRQERYRFLDKQARACGAGKIATGHHLDDQAETVLLNLIRGSGPEGLGGIAPVWDGRIIRPLLEVSREEILAFLHREGLIYRVDSSNRDPLFLRNRVRSDLLPLLKADYNPRIAAGLCRTAGIMRREDDYLQAVVRDLLEQWRILPGAAELCLSTVSLTGVHEALQARIVKTLLEAAVPSGNGIAWHHIEAVLTLIRRGYRRPGGVLDLPGGIRVEQDGDAVRFRRMAGRRARSEKGRGGTPQGYVYPVEIPGTVHIRETGRTIHLEWVEKPGLGEMKKRPQTAFMDAERIFFPLSVRSWAPGDRMTPLGMSGLKKMKDYFIDRKIPAPCRRVMPLLADRFSVVWIAGERIDERVKVREGTKKVLKAEMV